MNACLNVKCKYTQIHIQITWIRRKLLVLIVCCSPEVVCIQLVIGDSIQSLQMLLIDFQWMAKQKKNPPERVIMSG